MAEVFIEIEYNVIKNEFKLISTNAKRPNGLVENYLASVVGKGVDNRKFNEKEKYRIRIEVDLSYDKITCKSDTGNHGLTAGILMLYLHLNKEAQ